MITLTVAGTSLHRLLRDRRAMFFVVVLPVVVILVVGLTVRGFDKFRVGVIVPAGSGALARELAVDLQRAPALDVRTTTDASAAEVQLRRGELAALVVLPAGYDRALTSGGAVQLPVLTSAQNSNQEAVYTAVAAAVSAQSARVQAARFAAAHSGLPFASTLARAGALQPHAAVVTVQPQLVQAGNILPPGFNYSAPTMLVLFVFINALAGGAFVIQARQLGIYQRALAAPVRVRSVLAGEGLATLAVALLQSALIVMIGALVFSVRWGNPLAAACLIVTWAAVGAGAGMLSGALFHTAEQASAIGPALGIALGMLGGCMWPLEIASPLMRTIGHFTPHAWAVDAWTALLSRDGTVVTIAPKLAVLGAFALALLALASARLRRRILA